MDRAFKDVKEFMMMAGQPVRAVPELPAWARDDEGLTEQSVAIESAGHECVRFARALARFASDERAFRARLLLEELGEVLIALAQDDIVEVADGLADLDFVTIGTAVQFGLPHVDVWEEVDRANRAKFPNGVALRDAQGKVKKPPGWQPPDVAGVLAAARRPADR